MTSSTAYILLNKEKKLQGVSSSCIQLMNIDTYQLKRLSASGIDINILAPDLFLSDDNSAYLTK